MSFEKKYELATPVSDADHAQGSADARVTLVEYGDYQCPHCGHAYPIVQEIQKHFGDDLRFVYRNFPLTEIHQYSFHAAEAAEIAGDYDKFWEMHDMLFENQETLDDVSLIRMASSLGIDGREFAVKLESNAKAEKVKSDFMSGVNSGVSGTPSFFINGYKYEGPWDFDDLKAIISGEMQ